MKHVVAIAVAVLALTTSARAAAVDGKWAGAIDTPNGPAQISFTFQADGTTLTGSTTGPDGNVVKIKSGKIDGDKISFAIDLDFGGMPFTLGRMRLNGSVPGCAGSSSSIWSWSAISRATRNAAIATPSGC